MLLLSLFLFIYLFISFLFSIFFAGKVGFLGTPYFAIWEVLHSQYDLICSSLLTNKLENPFICVLAIWISSTENCIFKNSSLFFFYWVVGLIYYGAFLPYTGYESSAGYKEF